MVRAVSIVNYIITFSLFYISLTASGNVVDVYGLSPHGVALGNNVATGGDPSFGAYTNPASLTEQEGSSVTVGYHYADLSLKNLNQNASSDRSGLGAPTYDASRADALAGTTFGLNLAITPKVHFGLAGYLPSGNFGRLSGSAANESNYLRYADRQQRPAIYTGAAAKFGSLALGLGSYYTLKARGVLQMSLNNQATAARFDLEMIPVLSFYGGLLWSQTSAVGQWKVGVNYRAPQATESKIDTFLAVGVIGDESQVTVPMAIQTTLVPFYDPELIRIGFSNKYQRVTVYGGGEMARWSRYKAPRVELGGDDLASLTGPQAQGDIRLQDTRAWKLGMAYDLLDSLETQLRIGLEHHESATDNRLQDGIIDLERQVLALGVGLKIPSSALPEGRAAFLDVSLQRSQLASPTLLEGGKPLETGGHMDTIIGGLRYEL